MVLLLFFAFLSGFVTILTPCIWPLLPIVLSTSVTGKGKHRALGITLGIMISFAIATLTISYLVKLFHFDPNILRLIAVVVISFLGLTLLIPFLSAAVEGFLSKVSSYFGNRGQQEGNGFLPGILTGFSLGIVWSPCAGPILAAIATLAATGNLNLNVIFITFFYVLGVGIPLFAFAYGGQKLFLKAKFISSHTKVIQQVFGLIMILTALAIYTNYDVYIQSQLLNAFPSLNSTLSNIGNNQKVFQQLNQLKGQQSLFEQTQNPQLFNTNTKAPDFRGGTKWLNTEKPFSIDDLKGKVVLVDFWTYTCINCIRTFPFVTSWYDKYKDDGFVVIGVHTPEFEFEKNTSNVLNAISQYKINYPVVQDNEYNIWNNYSNQYWPAEYLIDVNGVIRRTHFGEGEYDQTEQAIQILLKEAGVKVTSKLDNMPDQTPKTRNSPETYIGSKRMQYYYPNGNTGNVNQNFTLSGNLPQDSFSLGGQWNITDDQGLTGKNAALNYNFYADKIFLVLRPSSTSSSTVKVFLDGKQVDSFNAGSDVHEGLINVDKDKLYNLIDLKGNPGSHILKLEFDSGIQVFAFTFG